MKDFYINQLRAINNALETHRSRVKVGWLVEDKFDSALTNIELAIRELEDIEPKHYDT